MEMISIAGGLTRFASENYIDIATTIDDKLVSVYDKKTNTELLSISKTE